MGTWSEFRRAVWLPTKGRFRPSSDADLDAFEEHAGIKLPVSYREFAKIFGACAMMGGMMGHTEFMFAAPRRKKGPRQRYNLFFLAERLHGLVEADTKPIGGKVRASDPAQSLRMVFFCSDGGDGRFGWDPEDVSDAVNHEYAVYVRYSCGDPYTRLASSFEEFVLSYCTGDQLARWREAGCPVREKRGDDPKDDKRIRMSTLIN